VWPTTQILDGDFDHQTRRRLSLRDRSTRRLVIVRFMSGGTSLEQFATFRRGVSIAASIQAEIGQSSSHAGTLPLTTGRVNLSTSFEIILSRDPVSLMTLVLNNDKNNNNNNIN